MYNKKTMYVIQKNVERKVVKRWRRKKEKRKKAYL